MQFWHGCAHIRIAFVGTNHNIARFGNTKVTSSQACFGVHKVIPQTISGTLCEVGRVVITYIFTDTLTFEQLSNLLTRNVNGRHHDMTRFFLKQL